MQIFKRPLRRDMLDNVAGGVCAGLAKSLEIDVAWIRIAFVLLALLGWGFPVLIYIVMWIAVPEG